MTTGREKMKIGANTCTPFLILSLALVKKERLKEEVQGEYIFTYSDTKIDRLVYLTFDDGRKKSGFVCRSIPYVSIDSNPDINVGKETDYE